MTRAPEDCTTKAHIREEIDRLDRELIARLADRFAYVRRMAELKQLPDEAYHQARIDEVLAKVGAEADATGVDRDLIISLWRQLIDWNIDWEREAIAARIAAHTTAENRPAG
jgi:isochorismate pyruvate lyase